MQALKHRVGIRVNKEQEKQVCQLAAQVAYDVRHEARPDGSGEPLPAMPLNREGRDLILRKDSAQLVVSGLAWLCMEIRTSLEAQKAQLNDVLPGSEESKQHTANILSLQAEDHIYHQVFLAAAGALQESRTTAAQVVL